MTKLDYTISNFDSEQMDAGTNTTTKEKTVYEKARNINKTI